LAQTVIKLNKNGDKKIPFYGSSTFKNRDFVLTTTVVQAWVLSRIGIFIVILQMLCCEHQMLISVSPIVVYAVTSQHLAYQL